MLRIQLTTLVFQVLNFFILLTALTWFFYRPLLRMMKRREDDILARLRAADERAKQADSERAQLAALSRQAQTDAESLLERARVEAAQARQQMLEAARREAASSLDAARTRMDEQERAARTRLEGEARRTAVAVAGDLIHAAVGPAFHQALVERLLETGLTLDGPQGDVLRRALAQGHGHVTVEMAYEPSPELRARIEEALAKALPAEPGPRALAFRVASSLRAGLRVLVGTVAVDMSLSHILADLERQTGATPGA
jgi:F-type H+-transporting ATPase subunit b